MRKKYQNDFIDYPELMKVNPNSLVFYKPRNYYGGKKVYSENDISEETDTPKQRKRDRPNNKTNGFLSDRAGSRLKNYIKYLFWISGCYKISGNKIQLKPSGHISFMTLTLCASQMHFDTYIKDKMLNQFITELSKKFPGIVYIWRAEKQQNGSIHFHFLVNKFIPWKWCRMVWNRILLKEGYLQRYQDKFKNMWLEEYLKQQKNFSLSKLPQYVIAYKKGVANDWTNPNTTDITDLRDAKTIYHYVSKYISKNNNDTSSLSEQQIELLKVEGHLYFCSSELLSITAPKEMISKKIEHDLNLIKLLCPESIFCDDFIVIVKKPIEELFNLGCFEIYNIFIQAFNLPQLGTLFQPAQIEISHKTLVKKTKQLTLKLA